jgi:hypothetical protein
MSFLSLLLIVSCNPPCRPMILLSIVQQEIVNKGDGRESGNAMKPFELYVFLRQKRYWIFSSVIFMLMFARTLTGFWTGDFWEHAAVVRELATNPLSPRHPQLLVEAQHAFFSPYSLGVALLARVINLDPITSLAIAGLGNLVLFLIAFRWFIVLFFDDHGDAISFYALLFILILWGKDPWFWSAFFHIFVLGFALPYPSTFASACIFISFGLYLTHLKTGKIVYFLLLIPLMSVVFLTHPTTAVVMCIALTSFSLGFPERFLFRNVISLFAAFTISFAIAAAWPYYSFLSLITGQSPDFHGQSRILYQHVFSRTFPALIGIPLLVIRFRKNILDPLGLTFLGLTVVYCYGYLTNQWGYGRVISHMMMVLQISLAALAARIESGRLSDRTIVKLTYAGMLALAVVFVVAMVIYKGDDYRKYSFLSRYTKQYDLVLSDLKTSLYVPAFGGKVIANPHPLYFIADYAERQRDLVHFFDQAIANQERMKIIKKYQPAFLLFKRAFSKTSPSLYDSLGQFGTVIYSDGNFILLSLKKVSVRLHTPLTPSVISMLQEKIAYHSEPSFQIAQP